MHPTPLREATTAETPGTDASPPAVLGLLGVATAALGVGFAIAAVALRGPLEQVYASLASAGTPVALNPTAQLATGIYGGLMAGWGVTLALLAGKVSRTRAAALGALSWWLVDSTASVATGFAYNALSNTGFLVLFAPILVAAWRERRTTARRAG